MYVCLSALSQSRKRARWRGMGGVTIRQQDSVKREACIFSLHVMCVCACYLHPTWSHINYHQIGYWSHAQAPGIDLGCAVWCRVMQQVLQSLETQSQSLVHGALMTVFTAELFKLVRLMMNFDWSLLKSITQRDMPLGSLCDSSNAMSSLGILTEKKGWSNGGTERAFVFSDNSNLRENEKERL